MKDVLEQKWEELHEVHHRVDTAILVWKQLENNEEFDAFYVETYNGREVSRNNGTVIIAIALVNPNDLQNHGVQLMV